MGNIGSETMCIPIICWDNQLTKFEKQETWSRMLTASFMEALSIVS